MPSALPLLFQPWSIGPLTLRNRIVVPPLCMYQAKRGKMGAFHEMHIGSLASGGAGLVILEATGVSREGRISKHCCGLWDDETAAAMKAVIDRVREYSDVPIAIQLQHAGRKSSGGDGDDSWTPVAPSALAFEQRDQNARVPHALTKAEIRQVIEDFVQAAKRAVAIGLAGIELHFAHGYLAHQFLSPLSNQRTDEYGGSLTNRLRFPLELYAAVQKAMKPHNVPVWVRISATEWSDEAETTHPALDVVHPKQGGDAAAPRGWHPGEAIVLCERLKELGCEVISVSTGGNCEDQHLPPIYPGYQLPFAQAIRQEVGMQTIGVGLITTGTEAEVALQLRSCDAVAVGRGVLFNPRWAYQAAHDLGNGAKVLAPHSYHRCEPRPLQNIF